MNDRILLILKYKNISAAKLADDIDVQRSSISHILSERNKPSLEFIQKILKKYPEISPEWLISGKGPMLKNPELFAENPLTVAVPPNEEKIPDNFQPQVIQVPEVLIEMPEKETVVKKEPAHEHKEANKEKAPGKTRSIEKIVVFYTDNTFKEYFPEK